MDSRKLGSTNPYCQPTESAQFFFSHHCLEFDTFRRPTRSLNCNHSRIFKDYNALEHVLEVFLSPHFCFFFLLFFLFFSFICWFVACGTAKWSYMAGVSGNSASKAPIFVTHFDTLRQQGSQEPNQQVCNDITCQRSLINNRTCMLHAACCPNIEQRFVGHHSTIACYR